MRPVISGDIWWFERVAAGGCSFFSSSSWGITVYGKFRPSPLGGQAGRSLSGKTSAKGRRQVQSKSMSEYIKHILEYIEVHCQEARKAEFYPRKLGDCQGRLDQNWSSFHFSRAWYENERESKQLPVFKGAALQQILDKKHLQGWTFWDWLRLYSNC